MKTVRLLYFFICVIICISCNNPNTSQIKTNTVYDRVIESGTIRASFAIYPPYCLKDPNTGELKGIMVDILTLACERLQLKLEWTEEVGWGTIFEGLTNDRYDLFGAGVWKNSSRGKVGGFSRPMFYNPIMVWGRPDEIRFSDDLSKINSPKVKISTLDGAIDDLIAKSDYPLAKTVSVPQMNPWTDVLLNITTEKADITFAEPGAVRPFLEKNPGTLKNLTPKNPVRVFAICYTFKIGEYEFETMLNSALDEIINDGSLERILQKYEVAPGELLRVALPYQI